MNFMPGQYLSNCLSINFKVKVTTMACPVEDAKALLRPGNEVLCETYYDDMTRAEQLKQTMPEEDQFVAASRRLKAAADPVRVKLLYALGQSELCVCEMAHLLDMSLPAVSHHLRILRDAELVRYRKEGRLVFYSLRDEILNGAVTRLVDSL